MATGQTVGDRIKRALERKGWSQTDLADAVHVTQPAVGQIISGSRPGRSLIPQIADALGVPAEWLTVGDNPPPWAAGNNQSVPDTAAGVDLQRTPTGDAELWKTVSLLQRQANEQLALLRESDARNHHLEQKIAAREKLNAELERRLVELERRFAESERRRSDEGSRGGRRKTTEVK